MDAIEFLIQQHLEVESLFDQFESALGRVGKTKLRLCWKLGDLLTVHTTIEETILYPATKDAGTEKLLDCALEEHLSVRPIVAGLVELDEVNEEVEAMMAALRGRKKRHADEEEKDLFARARELLAPAWLEDLGRRMEKMTDEYGWVNTSDAENSTASRTKPRTTRSRILAIPRNKNAMGTIA